MTHANLAVPILMKFRILLATSVVVTTVLAASSLFAADKPAKAAPAPKKEKATAPAAKKPAPAAETAPAAESAITDPVAVVDGEEINKAELDAALETVLAQQGRSAADIPPEQQSRVYRMLLDDLIVEKIIAKKAVSVEVPEAKVKEVFDRLTANFGSEEEAKAQIEKSGQSIEAVKKNIVSNLKVREWLDEQVKGKTEVTDADADEFYRNNPDQFKMPEQVRASHILLKIEPDAAPKDVIAKQEAAKKIIDRLKKGEAFDVLAVELSEDPSAKQNKGDLDFFQKDQMVPEFANVAFAMKKGELSPEPVRTQFGYHVIKVTDRKDPETVSLETAKPKVMEFLSNQKKNAELQKIAQKLRTDADVKINLPPDAAPAAPAAQPSALPAEVPPAK